MSIVPRQTLIMGGPIGGITAAATGALPANLAVTGYTGGGSTNLDGLPTVHLSVPQLFSFVHASEGFKVFLLRAGTDAAAPNGIIRPLDFNAVTNAKVWVMED